MPAKKLLCHIDHQPCLDTVWVENRWKDGSGERLLDNDNEELQNKMSQTKRNFIQVFSLVVEKIEET